MRKNGVNVGRVKQVKLLNDDKGVDLVLELDQDFKIKAAEICRVGTGSLITGDAVVEFVPPTQQSLFQRFDGRDGLAKDGQLSPTEEAMAKSFLKDGDFLDGGELAPDHFRLSCRCVRSLHPPLSLSSKPATRSACWPATCAR